MDRSGPGTTRRDEAAFAALVREHAGSVFAFAYRRTGDRGLAEDVAQETMLRAWRGRAGFRGESSERGWLLAIAGNVVRDHRRMRSRRVSETPAEAAPDAAQPGSDPAERAVHAEAIEHLLAALEALPEHHREMFLLRERDGLSYKEIAAVLACPIGSVMSGLARARERLMGAIES